MYRKITSLVLTVTLGMGSSSVLAANGFYLGAGAGISDLNTSGELRELCDNFGVSCTSSESDVQIKGVLGYRFNDYLALEGSVYDIGEPSVSTQIPLPASASIEMSGGSISILPHLPLSENASLFLRVGATAAEATATARVPSQGLVASDSTTAAALILGFGGQFDVGRNFSIRFEWERYSFDEVLQLAGRNIDAPEIDVLSAAVIYTFAR